METKAYANTQIQHTLAMDNSWFFGGLRVNFGTARHCEIDVRAGGSITIRVTSLPVTSNTALTRLENPTDKDREKRNSVATPLDELRRLVTLQEQITDRARQRYKAGQAPVGEVAAAEIDLLEAKIRLATAENKQPSVIALLKELRGHHEQVVEITKKQAAAGTVTADEVSRAEKNLAEVGIRLRIAEAKTSPKP